MEHKLIKLNVGGTIFETYDDTLSKISFFKDMLENCDHTSIDNNIIFIDCDPKGFRHILEFARMPGYKIPSKYEYLCDYFMIGKSMIEYDPTGDGEIMFPYCKQLIQNIISEISFLVDELNMTIEREKPTTPPKPIITTGNSPIAIGSSYYETIAIGSTSAKGLGINRRSHNHKYDFDVIGNLNPILESSIDLKNKLENVNKFNDLVVIKRNIMDYLHYNKIFTQIYVNDVQIDAGIIHLLLRLLSIISMCK